MKKLMIIASVLFLCGAASAEHYVSGYFKKNGTYVASHKSMDPYEARSTEYHYRNNIKYYRF